MDSSHKWSNKGPVHQNLTFRDLTVSEGRRDVTWLVVYLLIVPVWRSWRRLCCSAETFPFISSPRSSPRRTWWGNTNASLCAAVSWSLWSSYQQPVFVSSRTLWRSSGQRPAWWSPPHTTPNKTTDTRWCHESIHLAVAGQVTGIIIRFSDCLSVWRYKCSWQLLDEPIKTHCVTSIDDSDQIWHRCLTGCNDDLMTFDILKVGG